MRKFLRFTLVSLLAMFCGTTFAQKTATFDFTGDEAYGMNLLSGNTQEYNADPYECKEGDVTLTLNGSTRWWKATSSNELRFYKGSNFNVSVIEGNVITSITIDAKAPSNFSTTIGSYDNSNGGWTGKADNVSFDCTLTKSNTPIYKMTVTYEESAEPVKKDPQLAFSETSVSAVLGEEFTAPTLTKDTDADVVYSSSDEDVATVDAATGEVTIVGEGSTTITATAEETDEYSAGSASYTLKVTAPALTEVTVPYYESFEEGIGSFTINDVNLSEGLNYVWKHDSEFGYMKASAFVSGSNKAAESWLVSPTINLEGVNGATLKFTQTINKYFGTIENEATLWIKEEGGDWKQVEIAYPAIKSGSNWSDAEEQTIDLKDYVGKKIKVGFKYVSTEDAAGTWEIEGFSVTRVNTGDEVVTLPYEEGFENGQGLFIIDDVNLSDGLSYVWKHDSEFGYMKASAFVGENKSSESWLVSPIIDLTNISEATLTFTQTINKYFGNVEDEATLWIKSVDGEWQQVTISYPEITSGNWSDAEEQVIDLKDYVGKKIQVGFKYVSTEESAGTWEIEDFSVTGTTSGIDNVTVEELDENAPMYNLAGQRISKDAKGIVIQNGKKYIRR